MFQAVGSVLAALFSTAVIFLAADWTHPNPTRGGSDMIGVLITLPSLASVLWALLPSPLRPEPATLRQAIVFYAACAVGLLLGCIVFGVLGSAFITLPGWLTVVGFFAPLLIVVAGVVGVATPTQSSDSPAHAIAFRIATAVPIAIGLVFHIGYAFYFQSGLDRIAEGKPYCVGVFEMSGGREFYRPANFYDFTLLSLRMDEISTGNGSYRPGHLLIMEIGSGSGRETVSYDERDQSFYIISDLSNGSTFARDEVEGCRLR